MRRLLLWLNPGLVSVLHVIRMMRDLFDHVLQQIVSGKHWIQFAVVVVILYGDILTVNDILCNACPLTLSVRIICLMAMYFFNWR